MEVLLFGIAKDIVGKGQISFSEADSYPTSVGELKDRLRYRYPEFGSLSSLAVAVNNEYAQDGKTLSERDEIAIIPPVSGG